MQIEAQRCLTPLACAFVAAAVVAPLRDPCCRLPADACCPEPIETARLRDGLAIPYWSYLEKQNRRDVDLGSVGRPEKSRVPGEGPALVQDKNAGRAVESGKASPKLGDVSPVAPPVRERMRVVSVYSRRAHGATGRLIDIFA